MQKSELKTGKWSEHEQQLFQNYFRQFGNDFKQFEELLKMRTINQIKSYYHNVKNRNRQIMKEREERDRFDIFE
ncbi:Myb domain [Hexamita inflata]|uniref:Myb domain n=1 Tax=Hexamita inflata TaxID=28002 RepID=A0AA86Q5X7_9EUKA|nr:Myb domain [Hexamita inflata]